MKSLNVNNDLLDNREALDAAFDEQGYLFFKDVVDRDALATVQARMRNLLTHEYHLVESEEGLPSWNGKDTSELPNKVPGLYRQGIWQEFTSNPKVNSFFEKV